MEEIDTKLQLSAKPYKNRIFEKLFVYSILPSKYSFHLFVYSIFYHSTPFVYSILSQGFRLKSYGNVYIFFEPIRFFVYSFKIEKANGVLR